MSTIDDDVIVRMLVLDRMKADIHSRLGHSEPIDLWYWGTCVRFALLLVIEGRTYAVVMADDQAGLHDVLRDAMTSVFGLGKMCIHVALSEPEGEAVLKFAQTVNRELGGNPGRVVQPSETRPRGEPLH